MSQRSQRETRPWRCPKCGNVTHFFSGERRVCPYKLLDRRVVSGRGAA